MVTKQGSKISEAARSLDIGTDLQRHWQQQFDQEGSGAATAETGI